MSVNKNASELDIFAATIYAEARGESHEGQKWVAWVIKNRANKNRSYWGGKTIKDVCLHRMQFECWNAKDAITIKEPAAFDIAKKIAIEVMNSDQDPTGGSDHYINPKGGIPKWTANLKFVADIQNHRFYKS